MTRSLIVQVMRCLAFSSFEEFPTVCNNPHKDFLIVNEAGVDVFLQFPCFFYDPVNDGNLISGFLSSLNQICPSARAEGN